MMDSASAVRKTDVCSSKKKEQKHNQNNLELGLDSKEKREVVHSDVESRSVEPEFDVFDRSLIAHIPLKQSERKKKVQTTYIRYSSSVLHTENSLVNRFTTASR